MKKALVVYYTWSNGNTEGIAKQLQAQFDSNGGDEVITPQSKNDKWTGDVKKLCSK